MTVFIITNSFVETTAAQQIVLPPDTSNLISYYSEDITFENRSASITLTGTMTLPQKIGKYPAVILISGNGEQNRDAEFSGHKPFLVMAEYLPS